MYVITTKKSSGQIECYKKDQKGFGLTDQEDRVRDYEESIQEFSVKHIVDELIRLGITEIKIEKEQAKYVFNSKQGIVLQFDIISEACSEYVSFKPREELFLNEWGGVKKIVEIVSNMSTTKLVLHEEDEFVRPLEEVELTKLTELGLDDTECYLLESEIKALAAEYIKAEQVEAVNYAVPVGEATFNINNNKINDILNNNDGMYLFNCGEQFSAMDTYISMNSKFVCPEIGRTQTLSISVLSEKNAVLLDVSIFDSELDDPWNEKEELQNGVFRFCPKLALNIREPLNYLEWVNVVDERTAVLKMEEITGKLFLTSRLIAAAVLAKNIDKVEEELINYLLEQKVILKNIK